MRVVGEGKPVDEESCGDEDGAGPDGAEPDFWRDGEGGRGPGGRGEGVEEEEAGLLAAHDVVDDPAGEALAQDTAGGEGAAVGKADDECVPVEELLENGGDGDGREDGGEAVHCGVVEGGEDDGWVAGHLERRDDELVCTELELGVVGVEAEAVEVGAFGEWWLCWCF